VQAAARHVHGSFAYLEIGSHLGGSLQTFMRDPACTAVLSIDPRPHDQPDARGRRFTYEGNSTERMLENLRALAGVDLGKLTTLEAGTDELDPAALPVRPQVAFVDGEHTNEAALRDARFCALAMHHEGCVLFHDAPIVRGAIEAFVDECETFSAVALPNRMFLVELGPKRLLATEPLTAMCDESYRAYFKAMYELTRPRPGRWRRILRR